MNELIKFNGCKIAIGTIGQFAARSFRGWYEYTVTNGEQTVSGRSRGTKSEVVSRLKWKIDHNEMFPKAKVQS